MVNPNIGRCTSSPKRSDSARTKWTQFHHTETRNFPKKASATPWLRGEGNTVARATPGLARFRGAHHGALRVDPLPPSFSLAGWCSARVLREGQSRPALGTFGIRA